MTPYDYLENTYHWHAVSSRGSNIYGPCPFHQGMTLKHGQKPDFVIYPSDWHCTCYSLGCGITTDFAGLVWRLEFPTIDREDKKGWATQIFPRVRELGGSVAPPRHFNPQLRSEKPPATQEQQDIMTAASQWWHDQMAAIHSEIAWYWLEEHGIFSDPWPSVIGYAPRMSTALFSLFDRHISESLGRDDWYDLGVETGILREDGTVRLQERIVFSCLNERSEKIAFYQGRTIHDENTKRRAKFLNPPHLRKEPFFVPIASPLIEGTVIVESPKGPAILAPYRVPCMATLGSGFVRHGKPPYYIVTDNDKPQINKRTGEVIYPGEKLAENIIRVCQQERIPCYRIVPPLEDKGLDEWVKRYGVEPLLGEIARVRERG